MLLAFELGAPVDGLRAGAVGLDVRARASGGIQRRVAGEDVVGGDVHERGAGGGGGAREIAGAVGVDAAREPGLLLRAVDVGPGGAVDGGVGLQALECGAHCAGVGDIELGVREAGERVRRARAGAHDVSTEHARGSGDE